MGLVFQSANTSIVTSLPGSPVDGQEIRLLADSANGVVWHLRYRAASSSAYKWEFIGGSPLYAEVQTYEATATTSGVWQDLATVGPSITIPTLPSGGDFAITVGADIETPNYADAERALISYAIGGTAAQADDAALVLAWGSNAPGNEYSASIAGGGSVSRFRRKLAIASATIICAKYMRIGVAGDTSAFQYRWLKIEPVRVG